MKKIATWKKLSQKTVFEKYGRNIDKVVYEMPDGSNDEYYLRTGADVVATVALTKDNNVILARQYRPGPDAILNELPAGYMNKGEKPEVAAARELLEETGYAGSIVYVGRSFDDAYSTIARNCCVATECELVKEQELEKNEHVEVVLVSLDEFRKLLKKGELTDTQLGYMGLDYLKLL